LFGYWLQNNMARAQQAAAGDENCTPNVPQRHRNISLKDTQIAKPSQAYALTPSIARKALEPMPSSLQSTSIVVQESPGSWYDQTFKEELQNLGESSGEQSMNNILESRDPATFLDELHKFEAVSNELDDLLDSILAPESTDPLDTGEQVDGGAVDSFSAIEGVNPFVAGTSVDVSHQAKPLLISQLDRPLSNSTNTNQADTSVVGEREPLLGKAGSVQKSKSAAKIKIEDRQPLRIAHRVAPTATKPIRRFIKPAYYDTQNTLQDTNFKFFCDSLTDAVNKMSLGVLMPVSRPARAVRKLQLPEV
jgi:hypothetical protein